METARLNTSSSLGGLFPYHASGTSPEPLYAPVQDGLQDDPSVNRRLAPSGQTGDSVSISSRARQLYASSSENAVMAVPSMVGMPSENISLYNQIRRERDQLDPGDPRVVELTDKLRALLVAEKSMTPEEMGFIRHPDASQSEPRQIHAVQTEEATDQQDSRHAARDNRHNGTASKKQHLHAGDDSSVLAPPLSYSTPDSSAETPVRSMHASSSSSARLHGYMPADGSTEYGVARLNRVA